MKISANGTLGYILNIINIVLDIYIIKMNVEQKLILKQILLIKEDVNYLNQKEDYILKAI